MGPVKAQIFLKLQDLPFYQPQSLTQKLSKLGLVFCLFFWVFDRIVAFVMTEIVLDLAQNPIFLLFVYPDNSSITANC